LLAAGWLSACTPVLDWREVRIADSDVSTLFPCKPDQHARQVQLAGQMVRIVLYACTAGSSTWAVAATDVVDPSRVGPALAELRAAAARNLGASQSREMALTVAGATPNAQSVRVQIQGQLPDGRAVTEQLAVFAKGTRVYQATALGETLQPEAADTFFSSLRAGP
jgi:hypothetical protein